MRELQGKIISVTQGEVQDEVAGLIHICGKRNLTETKFLPGKKLPLCREEFGRSLHVETYTP